MNPENPTPQVPQVPQVPTPTPQPPVLPPANPLPPMSPTTPEPQVMTPAPAPAPRKNKKLAWLGLVVAGAIFLAGAGAAAYYGYILPNKPENRLARAFTHAAAQDKLTVSGKIDYQSGEEGAAVAVDYRLKQDLEKKHLSIDGKVGTSGASFPFDVRYLDKELYAKVGGLDSFSELGALAESDSEAAVYLQMLGEVNDKWYVLDRSFIQSAGTEVNCIADMSFSLTDEDVDKISDAYQKYPLFSIKSVGEAEIDGVTTAKYELDPASNETAKQFAGELKTLSLLEKIKECTGGDEGIENATEEVISSEEAQGTFTVYLDGATFKRIEITSDEGSGDMTMTMDFTYGDVTVEKPEGALPMQDLLGVFLGGYTGLPTTEDIFAE